MKEKEALEYEPFLNVKEGENLKLEVAEYDKKITVYIIAIMKIKLQNFLMKKVETFI